MYEDAWYTSLVPRTTTNAPKAQHKRRESLLKQPEVSRLIQPLNRSNVDCLQEGFHADIPVVEGIAEDVEEPGVSKGPPEATVARRAKSYSDFYEVVRAHIKKERQQYLDNEKEKKRQTREKLQDEVDFERWYSGISQDLLEAGHEEYRLVTTLEHEAGNVADGELQSLQRPTTTDREPSRITAREYDVDPTAPLILVRWIQGRRSPNLYFQSTVRRPPPRSEKNYQIGGRHW